MEEAIRFIFCQLFTVEGGSHPCDQYALLETGISGNEQCTSLSVLSNGQKVNPTSSDRARSFSFLLFGRHVQPIKEECCHPAKVVSSFTHHTL